jgi:hypothetical protein
MSLALAGCRASGVDSPPSPGRWPPPNVRGGVCVLLFNQRGWRTPFFARGPNTHSRKMPLTPTVQHKYAPSDSPDAVPVPVGAGWRPGLLLSGMLCVCVVSMAIMQEAGYCNDRRAIRGRWHP